MSELELAASCLRGDSDALAQLEEGPLHQARTHLASLGFAAAAVDDAVQRARVKLIVERGLESFRGRGPLSIFVRTTAVRLAIDAQRKTRRDVALGDFLSTPCIDPELEYMRRLYADHLSAAVRDAWSRLPAAERFILSLRVYEGMSVDDLASVYKVHRATAARRAAAARATLMTQTRACLRERLSVGDSTLDSILRIVETSVQLALDDALPHP